MFCNFYRYKPPYLMHPTGPDFVDCCIVHYAEKQILYTWVMPNKCPLILFPNGSPTSRLNQWQVCLCVIFSVQILDFMTIWEMCCHLNYSIVPSSCTMQCKLIWGMWKKSKYWNSWVQPKERYFMPLFLLSISGKNWTDNGKTKHCQMLPLPMPKSVYIWTESRL